MKKKTKSKPSGPSSSSSRPLEVTSKRDEVLDPNVDFHLMMQQAASLGLGNMNTRALSKMLGIKPNKAKKQKLLLPKMTTRKHANLGGLLRSHPLGRKPPRGPLCGFISKTLKRKGSRNERVLNLIQSRLVGTVFKTTFIFGSYAKYVKAYGNLVVVSRKPSLGQARLLIRQIINCESNFPWKEIKAIIARA